LKKLKTVRLLLILLNKETVLLHHQVEMMEVVVHQHHEKKDQMESQTFKRKLMLELKSSQTMFQSPKDKLLLFRLNVKLLSSGIVKRSNTGKLHFKSPTYWHSLSPLL